MKRNREEGITYSNWVIIHQHIIQDTFKYVLNNLKGQILALVIIGGKQKIIFPPPF